MTQFLPQSCFSIGQDQENVALQVYNPRCLPMGCWLRSASMSSLLLFIFLEGWHGASHSARAGTKHQGDQAAGWEGCKNDLFRVRLTVREGEGGRGRPPRPWPQVNMKIATHFISAIFFFDIQSTFHITVRGLKNAFFFMPFSWWV